MATITINLRSLGLTLTKGVEYRFDLDQGFVRDTTNQLPNPPNDNLLSFTTTGVTDFGISFGKGNNLILDPNTTFTVGPSTETYFVSDYIAAGYFSGSSGNIAIYNDDSTLLKSYAYEGDVLVSDDSTKIILDDTGMVATNQYHLVIDADIIYDSYNMLNETATPDFIMSDTGDNTIAGSLSNSAFLRHDDYGETQTVSNISTDNVSINDHAFLYFDRGQSTFTLQEIGTSNTSVETCDNFGSGFANASEVTMTNDTMYAVFGGTLKVYSATGGTLYYNALTETIRDSETVKDNLKVIASNKFITGDATNLIVGEVAVSGLDRTITTHTISAEAGAGTTFANKVAISDDYYACSDNNGVVYIYNVSDRSLVRSISTGYNGNGIAIDSTNWTYSAVGGINDLEINGDEIIVALDNFGAPTSTKSRVYSITTGSENTSANLNQGYRLFGDQVNAAGQKYFAVVDTDDVYIYDRKTYSLLTTLNYPTSESPNVSLWKRILIGCESATTAIEIYN